jgi:isopenicillin-N epimerase
LDWSWLHANHGSFGATPRAVLEVQQDWRHHMEAEPSRFVLRVLPEALRAAAEKLGAFLGADGQDIAFVENATVGCNAVLRSLRLNAGDEALLLSHGYPAVRNAVRYVTERVTARITEAVIPFPRPQSAAIVAGISAALTPRTRIAVIDHITSPSVSDYWIGAPMRRFTRSMVESGCESPRMLTTRSKINNGSRRLSEGCDYRGNPRMASHRVAECRRCGPTNETSKPIC